MIWSLASLRVKKTPVRLMNQLVALATDQIEDMAVQVGGHARIEGPCSSRKLGESPGVFLRLLSFLPLP